MPDDFLLDVALGVFIGWWFWGRKWRFELGPPEE